MLGVTFWALLLCVGCILDPQGLYKDGGDECVPVPEVCNDIDDDCDGTIDEDFNLDTNPLHCGECDLACPENPRNASSSCGGGFCVLSCYDGFADCDVLIDTGCESNLNDPQNCGDCDVLCPAPTPLCQRTAEYYSCVSECPPGTAECDGSCIDINTDVMNCGFCGRECPSPANASARCQDRECQFECDEGWGDCTADDGCETRLGTMSNCAGCSDVCNFANATARCTLRECVLDECSAGFANCDGLDHNGCEADLSTPATCGDCDENCDPGFNCIDGDCLEPCPASCDCYPTTCSEEFPCSCASDGCICSELVCLAGGNCDIVCSGEGTECTIDATAASNFQDFICSAGARCTVNLNGCECNFEDGPLCSGSGTFCEIDCRGVSNCNPRCDSGAYCILHCGSTVNCRFSPCTGGATRTCADNTFVCGGECP